MRLLRAVVRRLASRRRRYVLIVYLFRFVCVSTTVYRASIVSTVVVWLTSWEIVLVCW